MVCKCHHKGKFDHPSCNCDITITISKQLAYEFLDGQGEVDLLNIIRLELENN